MNAGEEIKKIALARAKLMPENLNMAIGGERLNKEALIKHIEQEDEIGQTIMRVDLEYLKDLASSSIY
ncbi:MAG: hypothetical protein UY17_C0017G0004 [Candidatus Beckwithbacteria bacterium GW2011_GWC2_47_9]|uniref:Uncharacterized protein n=1 Tax=Candidatus Beckwithbacteria bacterium GW2011_GWC2_47_9 TaxID=1618373 RepID=A0A0G1U071_9BACT|nr:MAG: hypothetical protein UY17_C0017G0004 [Candidatus Beckwithbacteria bacterium GW2011_GWC2_47_9]